MKNKIEDLRNHLFETIEMLKDGDTEKSGMTLEKAKTIAEVGQVIVNSAKVEVDFLRQMNGSAQGTGFIPVDEADKKTPKHLT